MKELMKKMVKKSYGTGDEEKFSITIFWVFPQGSDFRHEWQFIFPLTSLQQNAVPGLDGVALLMVHGRVTRPHHRWLIALKNQAIKHNPSDVKTIEIIHSLTYQYFIKYTS